MGAATCCPGFLSSWRCARSQEQDHGAAAFSGELSLVHRQSQRRFLAGLLPREAREAALAAAARTLTCFGPSPGLPAAFTAASCSASDGGSAAKAPVEYHQAGRWPDRHGWCRIVGHHTRGCKACGLREGVCMRRPRVGRVGVGLGVWSGVSLLHAVLKGRNLAAQPAANSVGLRSHQSIASIVCENHCVPCALPVPSGKSRTVLLPWFGRVSTTAIHGMAAADPHY
jgi:hypothetical protein